MTKNKNGRPPNEIDKIQFEKLCGMLCTETEICEFFEIGKDSLISWCKRTYGKTFQKIYTQKRAEGKITIRRNQLKLSERSAAMAIHLGKLYLDDQKNNIEKDRDIGEENNKVIINVDI